MKAFVLTAVVAYAVAGVHAGGHDAPLIWKQGPPAFKTAIPAPIPLRGVQENIVLNAELFPSAPVHPLPAPPKMAAPTFIILKQGHILGGGHGANFAGTHFGGQIGGHVGGGVGRAHAVAGPSYLVSTVHHVQKVSQGGKYLGNLDGHVSDAWPAGGHAGKIVVKGEPVAVGHAGAGW